MHHANLLIGNRARAYASIPADDRIPSPDVSIAVYDRMSIADVRTLIHEANLRPVAREYRVFIIECDTLLHEAQNALLKLFEEPNAHTVFYLMVTNDDLLLPTLRSRFHVITFAEEQTRNSAWSDFYNASYAERLVQIGKKLTAEDFVWVSEIVRGFETYAAEKRDATLMRDALHVGSYLNTNGSSKKMLLEHLALAL